MSSIASNSRPTSSPSCVSWFAHVPLIANNSWLCLIAFVFQLVCPCTAYRQQLLAAPHRLRVPVGLPMYRLLPIILGCVSSSSCFSRLVKYLLSPVILGQPNTFTPQCLMRSVVNDNTAAYLRHRGAIKIQAYYLVCP